MTRLEVEAAGLLPFGAASVADICARCRDSGAWLIGIDGFMGSGKSPLASMVEYVLGEECIRLDLLMEPPSPSDQRSYVERVNAARLDELLSKKKSDEMRVVEGVLLQKLLSVRAARSSVFLIYVAAVWSPNPDEVVWPEGIRLETTDLSPIPIYAEIETYHREYLPHETSDVVVIRDADRSQLSSVLASPDGQEFSIPSGVVEQANVRNWRARTIASAIPSDTAPTILPIGFIHPPRLGPDTRGLTPERLTVALQAMRNSAPLRPVQAFRKDGSPFAHLLDGAHRYFASLALGFTHIPCDLVTREDAKVRFAYRASNRPREGRYVLLQRSLTIHHRATSADHASPIVQFRSTRSKLDWLGAARHCQNRGG